MLSKADNRKKSIENSRSGKLLSDLETINEALHIDKKLSRLASSTASSRSKSVGKSHFPEPKMKPKDTKNTSNDSFENEKKSIWSWKGLKALTQVRSRRFNCCFSLLVHSIDGLPSFFNDTCLVVHWKRRDGELMTRPIRVHQGVAEFEEQLTHCCSVYGSRSGSHHSAKYEAKHFLLYASVRGSPDLDLGKHRIDLTRLLPLTLEDLEEEKSSGKWTTSFKLSGKAKGAVVNVSFGYAVNGNSHAEPSSKSYAPEIQSWQRNALRTVKSQGQFDQMDNVSIYRAGSLPSKSSNLNQSAEDIKDLHEVLPLSRSELSASVDMLYQKFDEKISNDLVGNKLTSDPASPTRYDMDSFKQSDAGENVSGAECEINEFSVIEKGVEVIAKDEEKLENDISNVTPDFGECLETGSSGEVLIGEDVAILPIAEESTSLKVELPLNICNYNEKEDDVCTKESLMKELESALICASNLANEGLDSQDETDELLLADDTDSHSNYRGFRKGKTLSLDDVSELVASDFLDMLGLEHSPLGLSSESEPESPRECLLRQFEKDALTNGGLLNFEIGNEPAELVSDNPFGSVWGAFPDELHHSSIREGFEERPMVGIDAFGTQTKVSRLEDMETEALMREWGFNEKAFQQSSPSTSGGFGSPVDILHDVPQQLPPLAEGLGPFMQTKNGGFLRSMNPTLFRNAKTGGGLIMQVSSPVVVPAEMGSGVMEILQGLASIGLEKLSMQASKLMPLEDITGKTMQQIAWEAVPSLHGPERETSLQHDFEIMNNAREHAKNIEGVASCSRSSMLNSGSISNDGEYVSLEDLAPLAMDKIEALSIEGLRIQSGLSDDDAPSNISPQPNGEFSAMKGKTVDVGESIGLDGAGGLKLMDVKGSSEVVDGLMGLSLTLDEWMKIDSGEIDDDDLVSERTSKILAAHHATSLEMFKGRSKGEKRRGKGMRYGLLGNNFTVGLMVQLRDPLRNYEPVGTPMLALIQVERLFVPPKPKIYSTVSLAMSSDKEEEVIKPSKREDIKISTEDKVSEELIPQYKITEVHVAGLKTEPGKKKLWGSTNQQQSGSRWLLANGMGKKNKHPVLKSKAVAKSSDSASHMTTGAHPRDTMWSISSRVQGAGAKWKEHAAQNRYVRNPNVVL